jgi:predicted O-methyltransferase YrrM
MLLADIDASLVQLRLFSSFELARSAPQIGSSSLFPMKQTSYPSEIQPADAFRRVLGGYEACGFDTGAIRQWCISELDGQMLVEATHVRRPKRILEVGTYVGVSTLLMALADATATIVTIDPNLALAAEMGSMDSDLGRLKGTVRTHDVARAVARQLGFEDRIQFVEGGFAIGETFSSIRSDSGARVAVVGPAVCAEHGPFDLIFIDGLHFASAVEADLRLAAEALAPGGIILMHDCIGMWGTNVRAGIFRFLAGRTEFRLSHPRYGELYRSIGLVFRADEHPDLMKRFRNLEPDASVDHTARSSIVSSIMRLLEPDFVVELAADTRAPSSILEAADMPAALVEAPIRAGCVTLGETLAKLDKAWQGTPGPGGLLVSFGLVDHLSEAQMRELLGWIRERDALAAFGFTPPGEAGIAGRNSRSFRHMVRLVREAGLSAAAVSRFDVDPAQFAFGAGGNERSVNSFCTHRAVLGSKTRIAKLEQTSESPILIMNEAEAESFEQENLLRLHYSCGFAWAFRQIEEQVARSEELVREIDKCQQADAELRHQLDEQVARSEDLVRQIASYRAVLEERQQVEVQLRRQIEERQQVEVELRRQIEEQVTRSEDLVRQIATYQAALDERQQLGAKMRSELRKKSRFRNPDR